MKHIVSVSLGSSKRNHRVETELLGENFIIERIGTDGDFNRVLELIREMDGKVDAFGMGGIDLYLYAAGKRYEIKDALVIKEAAKKTPIVDGSGLKNTLERKVIKYIDKNIFKIKDKSVLMVSATDRFGMLEAFYELGAELTIGDLMFSLDIPIPLKSVKVFQALAKVILPIATRMPFEKLYPTGKSQEERTPKHEKYFNEADIIAGDCLFIKRYMPDNLEGKIIITNTVTEDDIEELKNLGAKMLVTTTPEFNGRSFGTNVMEAVLVSIMQKNIDDITPKDYEILLEKLNFKPRVVYLNDEFVDAKANII
ncbi:hypothetical protein [Caloramator australicus]|uniref:Quinate 5-dehydrogenase n=1 Tax=Caloramator australicus RC3 TaxID=857293 RepID=I7K9K5_9CLOT|nr:hypothetical protein [Caloramator australicus]CCJ34315.1 FIG01166292: hypothetical protein [Caloramator australicus RC3]